MSSLSYCTGRPSRWWGVAAVTMILCGVGCGGIATQYQLEIRPTAEGFIRTVDVTSHPPPESEGGEGAPAPVIEKEREHFLAIYGEGERVSDAERFEREFSEETPADVGGSGSLVRWTSELGDVFVYHERFRGRLPTLREQHARQAAIDQLTQWILDWLDEELAALEGAEEIKRFVNHDLRTDLHDLVCLLEITASQLCESEGRKAYRPALLVGHFLVERGYLSVVDLAELPLSDRSEDEMLAWMTERFGRKLASASGLAMDAPALAILQEPKEMFSRFEKYLGSTAEYRLWREEQADAAHAHQVAPSAFLGESLEPVVAPLFAGLFMWRGPDQLTVVLHTAGEPMETNGIWDSAASCVQWDLRLSPRPDLESDASWLASGLPRIAFAQWAQPDSAAQTALFGEVLIQDKSLRAYCIWRKSLDEQRATRWSELLNRLPSLAPQRRIEALLQFDEHWTEESEIPSVVKQVAEGLVSSNRN